MKNAVFARMVITFFAVIALSIMSLSAAYAVYHPCAVVVTTSAVYMPNGNQLDTSGTTTKGIQVDFYYACGDGWDIFVLSGTYTLSSGLSFPPQQIRTIRMENVTLNFTSAVSGPAITLDSTMVVDWYMTGSIYAPNASYGVYFYPRNVHPHDGPLYGTKGIVDSRFTFPSVYARDYGVAYNTTSATVNDNTFAVASISSANHGGAVAQIGSGYEAYTNVWESGRTDDPIPFDLFNPTGWVTVIPPANIGEVATVYSDGTTLVSTANTTTVGLQEAVNYAMANNKNLAVFGRGIMGSAPNSNAGVYSYSGQVVFPPMVSKEIHFYGVTLNTGAIGGCPLTVHDTQYVSFELTGQIVAPWSNEAMYFQPYTSTKMQYSVFRIGHLYCENICALFDSSFSSIENATFYFHELLESDYGIVVGNPASTTYFRSNNIRSIHTHGYNYIGCQLGTNSANQSRIYANGVYVINKTDNAYPVLSLQVWGSGNGLQLVAKGAHAVTYGCKFEPGANNNTLYYGPLNATYPIVNYGSGNSWYPY